jgi:glycosyltransferase involved in cell wall biosynthesis
MVSAPSHLRGKRAAVLLFSYYLADPRPRRAAEALVDEGMQVEVICLRASPDEPARETVNGVDITRVPLKRRRGGAAAYVFQYAAFITTAFGMLAGRALRRRYALVHVHNMPDPLVFSALVPKLLGARVILDLHDPMPELMTTIFGFAPTSFTVRTLKRLERWSIAVADVVLTVNLACTRIFGARSCPPEKLHVVMNSPDEKIFAFRPAHARPGERKKPFVLMYHGSILERNGLDVCVNALDVVRRTVPDVELRIYGERTPFLDRVMEIVRTSGLEDAVRYYGKQDLDGIVAAIDDCDLGIIPNRRSLFTEINTPTRIFEYLSRGKPVVTGRAPGVCDYFDDDGLFFFELGDAEDLGRAIVRVIQHPHDVPRVLKRGQDVYLAHRWSAERAGFIERITRLLA